MLNLFLFLIFLSIIPFSHPQLQPLSQPFSQPSPSCPLNCQSCSPSSLCLSCLPPFHLFTNNTCLLPSPLLLGCSLYTLSNTCARCLPSSTLFHNLCHPLLPYCLLYTSAGLCAKCLPSYLLFQNQCYQQNKQSCPPGHALYNSSCIKVDLQNCQEADSGNVCTRCSLQYSLVNGICVLLKSTGTCAETVNGTCVRCQNNDEILFNNICATIYLDNCLQKSNLICLFCNNSDYILSKGTCKKRPIPLDPYCLILDLSTNQCAKCLPKYRLTTTNNNFNRTCVKINFNCLTVDNLTGNCGSCRYPLALAGGVCAYEDENCLQPNLEVIGCERCKPGWKVEGNGMRCRREEGCMRNYTDQKGNVVGCGECRGDGGDGGNRYKLSGGVCLLIPLGCVDVASSGECIQCSNSTMLFSGICIYPDPYCLIYDRSTGHCLSCPPTHFLSPPSCILLPPNCLQLNPLSQCISCALSYQLRNHTCIKTIPNCLYYLNSLCTQCQWYYDLSPSPSLPTSPPTCQQYPSLCNMVDSSGTCISCQQGLTLYFSRCIYYQTFCTQYSTQQGSSGNCIKVQNGFYLSENSVVRSDTIDTWDSRGNIIKCRGMLTRRDGVCTSVVVGCEGYDQWGNCRECEVGFALIMNQCIRDTNICIQRAEPSTTTTTTNTTPTKCLACIGGYLPFNGTCYSNQNNAQQWTLLGQPLKPSAGYILTPLNLIYPLPFNCLDFNILNSFCTLCSPSFTLSNGKCIVMVENCSRYNERGICQECIGGLRTAQGMCRGVEMCEVVGDNGCTTCKEGSRLMSGVCIVNFKERNCLEYGGGFRCLKCRNGYYLRTDNQTDILKQQCFLKPPNCLSVNPSTSLCTLCSSPYRLYNTTCLLPHPNCLSYSPLTSLCSLCSPGYTLLPNFTCYLNPPLCLTINVNTTQCTSCVNSNYVLVANETRCGSIVVNCGRFYQDGRCAECEGGYGLVGKECRKEGEMEIPSYVVTSTKSNITLVLFCTTYSSSNKCLSCQKGYYLHLSQSCIPLPSNCLQSNPFGICLSCSPSFTLFQNTCIPFNPSNIKNCKQANPLNTTTCLICNDQYYLSSNTTNQCEKLPENCVEVQNNLCVKCASTAFLYQNLCIKFVNNCRSYNTLTLSCYQCNDTYKLINNMCVSLTIASNCQILSSTGLCLYCSPSYTLSNGTCLATPSTLPTTIYLPPTPSLTTPILLSNCPPSYLLISNHCYKNISTLFPISTISSAVLVYSSISPLISLPCRPTIGSLSYWQAGKNSAGEWVGYTFPAPLKVHAVQVQGNGVDSYVVRMVLRYRIGYKKDEFECVERCREIEGGRGVGDVVTISLAEGVVAREMRVEVRGWVGQVAVRVEFLTD